MTMATGGIHHHHAVHAFDLDVLEAISTMPTRNGAYSGFDPPPKKRNLDTLHALRRPPIDPIVLAASLSSGPHVTRHHFHHSFGAKVESKQMSRSEREKLVRENIEHEGQASNDGGGRHRAGSYANCDRPQRHDHRSNKDASELSVEAIPDLDQRVYFSKQGPRSERLKQQQEAKATLEQKKGKAEKKIQRPEISRQNSTQIETALQERKGILQAKQRSNQALDSGFHSMQTSTVSEIPTTPGLSSIVRPPPITVRCYVRTRIPTPHGEVLCHLYRNNRDNKEHLALVVDTAQNAVGGNWEESEHNEKKPIRSKTLDEVWGPHETEMERIVRGAYVGRLGPNYQVASQAKKPGDSSKVGKVEAPLVRIHSECYTGETIGSQRCDCGEQLDEAIRLIHSDSQPARGVVVYLRQEGRGIGLLDKLMAYNLQDMGHDTVSANILLGHLADARKYDVAAEILRDLDVASCRLLTNNPEKMEALESEGITVETRVPMVPRVWRQGHKDTRTLRKAKRRPRGLEESIVSQFDDGTLHLSAELDDYSDEGSDASGESYVDHVLRRAGATLVGGSTTRGPELEKYLRTKVERMGHLLDLPFEETSSQHGHSSASLLQGQDGPLTDEEDLQFHVHADDADDEEDDEILIETQDNELG